MKARLYQCNAWGPLGAVRVAGAGLIASIQPSPIGGSQRLMSTFRQGYRRCLRHALPYFLGLSRNPRGDATSWAFACLRRCAGAERTHA
jgi:hypothetical protein